MRGTSLLLLLAVSGLASSPTWGRVPAEAPSDPPDETPDLAARPRIGGAVGELFATNTVIWSFNEYVRGAQFAQVSPRSWQANLDEGWTWDDNDFLVNQFAHPFQGALYYGAARNNGLDFWASSPLAFAGSLQWECCGERHPMSVNDLVATGMGGIALGEMGYRVSHLLWNGRTLPGWLRHGLAAGANPIGTLHRMFGDDHPAVRDDVPPGVSVWASARLGWRSEEQTTALQDEATSAGYFELDLLYGDPGRVKRPYDSFRLTLQANSSQANPLERIQIEGILASRSLARNEKHFTSLELVQGFDYVNTRVLEAGGQSIGLELREWRRFPGGWYGLLRGGPRGLVLAAVDSELAPLAEVADPERLREYDFGPGYGATMVAALLRGSQLVLGASAGWYAIETVNGAVYQGDNANHQLRYLIGRAQWPVHDALALGVEVVRYTRYTDFDFIGDGISVEARSTFTKVFLQVR